MTIEEIYNSSRNAVFIYSGTRLLFGETKFDDNGHILKEDGFVPLYKVWEQISVPIPVEGGIAESISFRPPNPFFAGPMPLMLVRPDQITVVRDVPDLKDKVETSLLPQLEQLKSQIRTEASGLVPPGAPVPDPAHVQEMADRLRGGRA